MGFKFQDRNVASGGSSGGVAGVSSVNGKTGRVILSSLDIRFNNAGTGLTSTSVQKAIEELKTISDSSKIDVSNIESTITDIISGDIDIASSSDCKGKVKVNALDELDFLDTKVDNETIQVAHDKLVAKTLDGLDSTIDEMNMLVGAQSNIQAQINALANVGTFIGAVDTKADLEQLGGMSVSDIVIVVSDETREGISTMYMYDGKNWIFVGEFKIDVRDFSTHPIILDKETIGKLPRNKMEDGVVFDTDLDLPMVNKITNVDGELHFDGKPINVVQDALGEMNEVDSVNGKKGTIVLDEKDVGAVANVMDTCGGIQVGTLEDRPSTTEDNLLYVVIDKVPNEFYRYDSVAKDWDMIGSSMGSGGTGETVAFAIDVAFNSGGTSLTSDNVQELGDELHSLINLNKDMIKDLETEDKALRKLTEVNGELIKDLDTNHKDLNTRVVVLEEKNNLFESRVVNLETDNSTNKDKINTLESNEGMVKSSIGDALEYLGNKVDGQTIKLKGNKLSATSLEGLNSSVDELNYSKGIRKSIQEQIDNLASVGSFTGSVDTNAKLGEVVDMVNGDMKIVTTDETRDGNTTMYMFNGEDWIYVSDFNIEIRDFSTNPIDLNEESIGILPNDRIEGRDFTVNPIDVVNQTTGKLPKDRVEQRDFTTDKINISTQTSGILGLDRLDTNVVSKTDVSVPALEDFKLIDGKLMYGTKEVNLNPYGDHRLIANEF